MIKQTFLLLFLTVSLSGCHNVVEYNATEGPCKGSAVCYRPFFDTFLPQLTPEEKKVHKVTPIPPPVPDIQEIPPVEDEE